MKLYFFEKSPKHLSADTDSLIKKAVTAYCSQNSLSPVSCEVFRTPKGKPYLEGSIHVGVTHTDSTIIIGVDKENFGIDCEEKSRLVHNIDGIMARFMSEGEKSFVDNTADRNEGFLEVWVKKEAYVKFTGEGLSGMKFSDTSAMSGFERVQDDRLIIYTYKES